MIDRPGFYANRDTTARNRYARVYARKRDVYDLVAEIYNENFSFSGCLDVFRMEHEDWRPFTPPEFPPLPSRPRLCYAKLEGSPPAWYCFRWPADKYAWKYEIVPHPDNEPEAIEIIQQAKAKFAS